MRTSARRRRRTACIFVDHAVEEVEAVGDFGDLGGVEVEAVDIAAEGEGGVVEGDGGFFYLVGEGGDGVVEFGDFGEDGDGGLEAFDDGAFFFIEGAVGGGGVVFDFFEVGEDARAGGEFIVFGGVGELGVINFFRLEFVEFELLAAEGAGGGEVFLLGDEGLPLMEEFGELAAEVGAVAEVVDDGELVGGLEEKLGVVLAVDVDENFADAFEHGAGDGVSVE